MKCYELCDKFDVDCEARTCRQWIEYEEDNNCTLIAIKNNSGSGLTLREVAERLNISFVRVKQIEEQVLKKLRKQNYKISELKKFLEQDEQ